MKIDALSGILTLVNLILIQGVDSSSPSENRDTDPNGRILYGKPASVYDFPFLVKLDIDGASGAGAIISNHWVLTAGHCVYNYACSVVMRILPATWAPGQSVVPVECFAHPLFSNYSTDFDIGLIKVREDLLLDGRAKAVPLPAPGTVYPRGTVAVAAGWGVTEDGDVSDTLLRADFLILEWDYCNNIWLEGACPGKLRCDVGDLPKRTLCTVGLGAPASSTCFGDSGGPVLISNEVAGIVSFGLSIKDTCEAGSPSLDTSVVDYIRWINFHIAPGTD